MNRKLLNAETLLSVRPLSQQDPLPPPNGVELSLSECATSAEHHAAHLTAIGLPGIAYDLRVYAAKFRNLAAARGQ